MAADLNAVAALLANLGATVEYPGCISIPAADGHAFWFGTVNANWGGDLMTKHGAHVTSVGTDVSSESDDAAEIAHGIREALTDAASVLALGINPDELDTLDVVSRALSVIEESDGADEHATLIAELRIVVASLKGSR